MNWNSYWNPVKKRKKSQKPCPRSWSGATLIRFDRVRALGDDSCRVVNLSTKAVNRTTKGRGNTYFTEMTIKNIATYAAFFT